MQNKALGNLPHGPEFRFIDSVLTLVPGQTGIGTYRIRGDENFLRGHFPGAPLFPGVLLVEAAAQMAGIVAQSDPTRVPLTNLRLTAIQNAKIFGSATPGEELRVSVRLLARIGGLFQAEAEITKDGQKLLTGVVVLSGEDSTGTGE